MLRDVLYHNTKEKVGVMMLVLEHSPWKNCDTREFRLC
jgi:hypothetical protein